MMNNDSVKTNEKEVKSVEQTPNDGAVQTPSETTSPNVSTTTNETATSTETAQAPTQDVQEATATDKDNPTTETSSVATEEVQEDPTEDIELRYLDKDFAYEMLSVPSSSYNEQRLVAFIMLWAMRNNVKFEYDDFGNVYLTKGTLEEGEFYPCVTSHLDTVQQKQTSYVYANVPLEIITTKMSENDAKHPNSHKLSLPSGGIGADDKAGVLICLSMFDHLPKLKACFFLQEEVGCKGSSELDKEWFKDVAYVIGWDSPDLYRGAYASSQTNLFNYKFYNDHLKEVLDKWGLVKGTLNSEPITDVKYIRQKTNIICMNFGNGGYLAHSDSEYIIIEDTDHALGMGIDLVNHLGYEQFILESSYSSKASRTHYFKKDDGYVYSKEDEDDDKLLASLSNRYNSTTTTNYNYTSTSKDVKFEVLQYTVARFDKFIENIKENVLAKILSHKAETTSMEELAKSVEKEFSKEITF